MFIEKLKSLFDKKKLDEPASYSKQFYCLGTLINLFAYGYKAKTAVDKAAESLYLIDDKMSVFKDYSELSRINNSSGKNFEKVSADTFYVIESAIHYSKLSGGFFDPTIRPLVSLWNIGKDNFKIPSETAIKESLELINYEDIILNHNNLSIMLKKTKESLDVGGIAKGFAADKIKDIFNEYKINSALIDLGGNIYASGKKNNGDNWNIGIQDPLGKRGEYVGIVNLFNKSIVTSGGYERYSIKNDKLFHHILDPKTGYPSDSDVISITIVSDNSIDGDGLSTGIYIMGLEKGFKLIESLHGIDGIFITKDKNIHLTSGIIDNFKVTNDNYNLRLP